jgi:hypothetical protein
MFRPAWPSSGVQDIYFHMLEGFCFAVFFFLVRSLFFIWSRSACFPFVFCSSADKHTRKETKKNNNNEGKQHIPSPSHHP